MVHIVEGSEIGSVWLQSLKLVFRYGETVDDNEGPLFELTPLYLSIDNPPEEDAIVSRFGDKDVLSFMQQNFQGLSPIASWGYSYAQRLIGSGESNQLTLIEQRLKSYPSTKSATLSLLKPEEDIHHTPCLTTLDFKVRNDALCLHAFFRSQDVGKKMYADALQLLRIGKAVQAGLPVNRIRLYMTVCSAHIYKSDRLLLETILATI